MVARMPDRRPRTRMTVAIRLWWVAGGMAVVFATAHAIKII
jgi:hypothetical protein